MFLLERKFRSKDRVGDNGLGGGWLWPGSWCGRREVGLGGWLVVVADGGWLWLVDVLWPATGVGVGGGSFLACGEKW